MSKKKLDEEKFDVRVLDHRLRHGEITPADRDAFLASLPDDAEHCAETDVRFLSPFADRYRAERPNEVIKPYDPSRFDRMEQPD